MSQTLDPMPGAELATPAGLIRDLCDLAAEICDARVVALALTEPELAMIAPILLAEGLSCRMAGTGVAAAHPGLFRLKAQPSQASDVVSVGLSVLERGRVLGILEIESARPDVLSQRLSGPLISLARQIGRHLVAIRYPGRALPQRLLALVHSVSEHDEGAASRVLTGLLRLAGDDQPSMVEVTALRIAGLAELAGPGIRLTEEGRRILLRGGVDVPETARTVTPLNQPEGARAQHIAPRPRPSWTVFARLAISKGEYEVGESGEYGPLAYRAAGTGAEWVELEHELVDGWTEIAAEIFSRTHDILHEYARMHMIRRRDLRTEEIAEIYDLHDLIWMLRQSENGYEVSIPGQPWERLMHLPPVSDDAPDGDVPHREFAILGLMQLRPDLPQRMEHDLRSWSRRMAAGAKVTPVLSPAAA